MPHAKLIVLIREPVERYASSYRMDKCRKIQDPEVYHEEGKMREYLTVDDDGLYPYHIQRGMYSVSIYGCLDRWMDLFVMDEWTNVYTTIII